MIEKNEIIKTFKNRLKLLKFAKKRTTWYRIFDDVIHVVFLKKSGYGDYYDMNTSLFLRALDNDNPFPAERYCHIRARVEKAFPDDGDHVMRALIMDYARFSEAKSIEVLGSFLSGTYAKFVDAHQDIHSIRRAYTNKELERYMIVATARRLLDDSV